MYIGHKIRALRKEQNMKLIELSEKSGVQLATLSRIEHMKMTGTLESHIQIARALGIDVTTLYTDIIDKSEAKKPRKEPKAVDMFVHSSKSSYEILATKILSKRMMPILLKIEAGGKTNEEQNKPGSEKFIYILEGQLEITVGDDKYSLSKGGSLYFNAALKHKFVNKGKKATRAVCVGTPVSL